MAPLCDEEQFQASLPPAWQHQQQKSSPFWIRNHILIPKLVPEVKGRSRALIGQSRVTCSLTEPMRSHAHPASWTDYAECSSKKMPSVLPEEEGVGTWQGKQQSHGSHAVQSCCCAGTSRIFTSGLEALSRALETHCWPFLHSARPSHAYVFTQSQQHLPVALQCLLGSNLMFRPSTHLHVPSGAKYNRFGLPKAAPTPSFLQEPGQPPHTSQNYCLVSLTASAARSTVL